jgi:tetratricopeptide (TPR) repeat protein
MAELPQNIDLDNPEFQQAFSLLQSTDANVFLTGKAGTGKSTFLKYICKHIRKKFVILAPTGVAAVNAGGVTIHSFFQMPLRPVPPDDPEYSVKGFRNSKKYSRQRLRLIREVELIVIDEVSMVRADMIDFIDRALRGIRNNRGVPFGGVQLLLVGDIFQLEPVVTPDARQILGRYYENFFFFNALAYQRTDLVAIELRKIYRQTDPGFISLLDRVRTDTVSGDDMRLLNSHVGEEKEADVDDNFGIVLTARRDTANRINQERMNAIEGEERVFEGEIRDDFPEKLLPTDMNLILKVGAQVMLIRNDKDRRWVNGTLAKVKEFHAENILIELENGSTESVERETWSNISYTFDEKENKVKEEILGEFTQYPLRAAWALTIHKSQGLTFSNVTIDMEGGAFSAGQTYVALSRCRSIEGLKFISPLRRYDVIVSKGASRFSSSFNDMAQTERIMADARTRRLSERGAACFRNEDFEECAEAIWEAHTVTGILAKRSVRRLIARYLRVVSALRKELSGERRKRVRLSKEMTEMGERWIENADAISHAEFYFTKAVEIDPDNRKAELGKARVKIKLEKIDEAKRILDRIIKHNKDCVYEASLLKGDLLADEGDLEGAVLNYQRASNKRPKEKTPFLQLIAVYENAGMEETAEYWRSWMELSL